MPIGWQELLIVLVIVLIVFGAGKLAGVGSAVGRSVREFREASREPDETGTREGSSPPASTGDTLTRDAAETK